MDVLDERRKEHREQDRRNGMKHPSAELLLSTETKQDPVRPPRVSQKAFLALPFLLCRIKASVS